MPSKNKMLREQREFLDPEFEKHGITYTISRRPTAHEILSFTVNGKPKSLTIAATTDWAARLRNRTILRQILEGKR